MLTAEEKELHEAIQQKSATLGTTQVDGQAARTGPSVRATLTVEGTRVNALVDSGSPVTIISLTFLLQVLANHKGAQQTAEEWAEAAEARLRRPTVTVKAYNGAEMQMHAEIVLTISFGEKQHTAPVLVQKGAPEMLLLGTDLITPLQVLQLTPNTGGELLLIAPDKPEPQHPPEVSVSLITATRIPARHEKLLRAAVPKDFGTIQALFEPAEGCSLQDAVELQPALVQPDPNGVITMVIRNNGTAPVELMPGREIGTVQPVTVIPDEETMGKSANVTVCTIDATPPERLAQLCHALQLDQTELTLAQRDSLVQVLACYSDVFALNDDELGTTHVVEHSIDTGEAQPIRQYARRIPYAMRDKLKELIEDMRRRGVIRPTRSPWASPVVLVSKRDGGIRFCVDYRRLNSVTKLDVYPLPRIDDHLDALAGSKYFSTLDLSAGFWQVPMAKDSIEKTAFVTHNGSYEFVVMPFGLTNAPATFQRLMETVLMDLMPSKCLDYIDDILVIGKTFEDHLDNLTAVLERLRAARLKLKPAKCHLIQKQVKYLGYVVSAEGVSTDPDKVRSVKDLPVPSDVGKLRAFLGLTSYYRRFIPDYAKVAKPLHTLTRKDTSYEWTAPCQEAFERLKQLLTEAPLLRFPDFSRSFRLETDASTLGLGAILAQELGDKTVRPISYASRTLLPHEKNYSASELEALGVVWAVQRFRHYSFGHHCDVYTDHQALMSLLNTPHPSGKLARWGLALQEMDLTIHYRPGKTNTNADVLSREPVDSNEADVTLVAALHTEDTCPGDNVDSMAKDQRDDPTLTAMMDYLESGVLPADRAVAKKLVLESEAYTMQDRVLYRLAPDKTQLLVVPGPKRRELFEEAHSGLFAAHQREAKVHFTLSRHYWWVGMRKDIKTWCKECEICFARKAGPSPRAPLAPIPVSGPFDRVGVDILKMPRSESGNKYVVAFVDYLTKWAETFAVPDQTALTIAKLLVEEIVPRHGVPRELLSDRGSNFLSKLMYEIYRLLGVKKINTVAYHPQTDGLVERFHRTLLDMLAKTCGDNKREWDTKLPYVMFAYRATCQESTKNSPFQLLYGRDAELPTVDMLTPSPDRRAPTSQGYHEEITHQISSAWEAAIARSHIVKAQAKQKRQYDKRVCPTNSPVNVGDIVFVHMPALTTGEDRKLNRTNKGPFRVTKVWTTGVEVVRLGRQRKSKP